LTIMNQSLVPEFSAIYVIINNQYLK